MNRRGFQVESATGYTAGALQTSYALLGTRASAFFVPAVAIGLAALIILAYPLDAKSHARIVYVLPKRNLQNTG